MINEKYDFIIQEPWLLDGYMMSPIERELILRKINSHGDIFPMTSAHSLLIQMLEYMSEQPDESFSVNLYGISCSAKTRLVTLLILVFGLLKHRSVEIYSSFDCKILIFKPVTMTGEVNWEYMGFVDSAESPDIILEYIGFKVDNGSYEYLTVLYDRNRQKHGFIRFSDKHVVLDAILESYLECLTLDIVGRYDDESDVDTSEEDISDEEP